MLKRSNCSFWTFCSFFPRCFRKSASAEGSKSVLRKWFIVAWQVMQFYELSAHNNIDSSVLWLDTIYRPCVIPLFFLKVIKWHQLKDYCCILVSPILVNKNSIICPCLHWWKYTRQTMNGFVMCILLIKLFWTLISLLKVFSSVDQKLIGSWIMNHGL